MSEVNIPLLRKAVEWAEAEAKKPLLEREWDQSGWMRSPKHRARDYLMDKAHRTGNFAELTDEGIQELAQTCGTSYCIAGYICHLAGLTFTGDNSSMFYRVIDANGVERNVSEVAAELLGNPDDTGLLFDAGNSIERVRVIAEEIAGEKL